MKASAASLFSLVSVGVQVGASNYFGNRIKVNKQSTTLSALLVRGGESNAGKDDPDPSIPHFETFSFESDNDISDPYSESQDLSDSASILASQNGNRFRWFQRYCSRSAAESWKQIRKDRFVRKQSFWIL